jgi:hypothetical protein
METVLFEKCDLVIFGLTQAALPLILDAQALGLSIKLDAVALGLSIAKPPLTVRLALKKPPFTIRLGSAKPPLKIHLSSAQAPFTIDLEFAKLTTKILIQALLPLCHFSRLGTPMLLQSSAFSLQIRHLQHTVVVEFGGISEQSILKSSHCLCRVVELAIKLENELILLCQGVLQLSDDIRFVTGETHSGVLVKSKSRLDVNDCPPRSEAVLHQPRCA